MELLFTLALPFVVALLVYQAFQFGKEVAYDAALLAHNRIMQELHLKVCCLREEIARLESENSQLKQLQTWGNDA